MSTTSPRKFKISKPFLIGIAIVLGMAAVGAGSAYVAYTLGTESLKGVSQPDNNPSKKFSKSQKTSYKLQPFTPIKEAEVIKKVKVYIQKQEKASKQDK